MQDLRKEVGLVNQDFSSMRSILEESLKVLQGIPEYDMLVELMKSLEKSHAEFNQQIGPAIDYLEQETKDVAAQIDKTQVEMDEVEKRAHAAAAEAAKPAPTPTPPKPPLVPGEGDPRYGFELGEDLLGLIGLGSRAKEGVSAPALGSVWDIESNVWKVDVSGARPPGQPPERPAAPKKAPPKEPKPGTGDSIGHSTDWDVNE